MLSWLGSIWNGFTGDVKDLYNRVISAITGVFNWASNEFQAAFGWILQLAQDVDAAIQVVTNAIETVFTSLSNWVNSLLDTLRSWVGQLVQDAKDAAVAGLNDLRGFVNSSIASLEDLYNGVKNWVISNVWDPLLSLVNGITDFVNNVVVPGFEDLFNKAVSLAQGLWNQLWSIVADPVNFVETVVRVAWPVIQQAWGWIVWLAIHPLEDMFSFVSNIFNWSPTSAMQQFESAMSQYGDQIENIIAQWFDL